MIAQNFSTPSYPLHYPNRIDCEWNINTATSNERILLIFTDFKTEKKIDIVEVGIIFNNIVYDSDFQIVGKALGQTLLGSFFNFNLHGC